MIMSREQNAGLCHSMKTDSSSIERVVESKYLRTKLTDQNSNQEEINTFTAIVDLSRSNFSVARAPLFQLKSAT